MEVTSGGQKKHGPPFVLNLWFCQPRYLNLGLLWMSWELELCCLWPMEMFFSDHLVLNSELVSDLERRKFRDLSHITGKYLVFPPHMNLLLPLMLSYKTAGPFCRIIAYSCETLLINEWESSCNSYFPSNILCPGSRELFLFMLFLRNPLLQSQRECTFK